MKWRRISTVIEFMRVATDGIDDVRADGNYSNLILTNVKTKAPCPYFVLINSTTSPHATRKPIGTLSILSANAVSSMPSTPQTVPIMYSIVIKMASDIISASLQSIQKEWKSLSLGWYIGNNVKKIIIWYICLF